MGCKRKNIPTESLLGFLKLSTMKNRKCFFISISISIIHDICIESPVIFQCCLFNVFNSRLINRFQCVIKIFLVVLNDMTNFSSVNRNKILPFSNNDNNDNNKNIVLSTENHCLSFHLGTFFSILLNASSPRTNPSWVGVYNNKTFSWVFVHTIQSPFAVKYLQFIIFFTWVDLNMCVICYFIFYVHYRYGWCKTNILLFIDFNSNDWPSVTYRCTLCQMIRLKMR